MNNQVTLQAKTDSKSNSCSNTLTVLLCCNQSHTPEQIKTTVRSIADLVPNLVCIYRQNHDRSLFASITCSKIWLDEQFTSFELIKNKLLHKARSYLTTQLNNKFKKKVLHTMTDFVPQDIRQFVLEPYLDAEMIEEYRDSLVLTMNSNEDFSSGNLSCLPNDCDVFHAYRHRTDEPYGYIRKVPLLFRLFAPVFFVKAYTHVSYKNYKRFTEIYLMENMPKKIPAFLRVMEKYLTAKLDGQSKRLVNRIRREPIDPLFMVGLLRCSS